MEDTNDLRAKRFQQRFEEFKRSFEFGRGGDMRFWKQFWEGPKDVESELWKQVGEEIKDKEPGKWKQLEEEAKNVELRLAFLKENFEYQQRFEEFKRSFKFEGDSEKFEKKTTWLFPSGFFPTSLSNLFSAAAHGVLLRLLDPEVDIDKDKELSDILPLCITLVGHGITQVIVRGHPEGSDQMYDVTPQPYQRLLLVDLRRSPKALEKEFKRFLSVEREYHKRARATSFFRKLQRLPNPLRKGIFKLLKPYSSWEIDKSRKRKEARQQLKIWKLKKEHISFAEIAKELNITADTAKHGFYKAYERSQNKKHDPDIIREKFSKVSKETFDGICASCPDKGNYPDCIETCSDALRYIDQDQVKLNWREKPLSEFNTEVEAGHFRDYLQYKNTI